MVERRRFGNVFPYLILSLGVFIIAFPFYLCLIGSTHEQSTIANGQMPMTPGNLFLQTYYKTLFIGTSGTTREPVGQMLLNSFVMASMIAVGKIAISIISAYAVVYFKFPFRMLAFWLIFMTLMLPVEVRIYPTYKIAADLQLLDSYAGLALPLIASATATLFFRQFFMTIPDELIEASKLDGAGPFRFFKDTVLPLSRTNIAALFVILFIYGWNQYLWPLLITTRDDMQTIVIGIKKMIVTADAHVSGQSGFARNEPAGSATIVPTRCGRSGETRPESSSMRGCGRPDDSSTTRPRSMRRHARPSTCSSMGRRPCVTRSRRMC